MRKSRCVEVTEIVARFQSLEGPRSSINRRHPLVSVVVIALMAVLSGADGPAAICRWVQAHKRSSSRSSIRRSDWLPGTGFVGGSRHWIPRPFRNVLRRGSTR